MKKILTLIGLFGSLICANAQTNSNSPFPLAGTWTLKAAQVLLADGSYAVDTAYGKNAKGILMIDGNGQYSLQIFRPERPKFASGNKTQGTAEEYRSSLLGISTHVGHIKLDPVNNTLQFNIDYAAFPNWDNTSQNRKFRLSGDELYYEVPVKSATGTSAVSVWTRVKIQ